MSAPLHPRPDSRPKSAFSWKGLLVGALLSLFIGIAAPYGAIVLRGSWWGFNSSSPGAICSFFVLTFGVNVLVGLIGRQHSLKKADLVMVYAMLLMAVSVSIAFVGYLIPHISGVYYYATAENNWSGIFFPHIPKWLAPQDFEAVKDLYEGLPPGAGMPWEAWLKPLACWYGFYLVLSFTMICMGVVLRRQWSHHERLAYPMTQLPIGMIEGMDGPLTRIPPFFKNRMMWLGFLLPFSLLSLSGMNHYIPEVPDVPFFLGDIRLSDLVRLEFAFSCAWVGFSYLVHLNVTFSIWFFYLLGKFQDGLFHTLGVSSSEQLSLYSYAQSADLTHQQMGACLIFVLYGLWIARPHLRRVWDKVWRSDGIDDSDEALPYRFAVLGFSGGLLLAGVWLWASGIPLIVLPVFLGVCLVFYIMVTRVVATAGLATARAPMVSSFFVISGMGTSLIGTKGLVALTFTYVWQADMRVFPMVACANALKLAETVPGPKGRLFWGMLAAVVCGMAGATWIILSTAYAEGGINLHSFFMSHLPQRTFVDMARPILNPTGPDARGWLFTGIGAAFEGFLMLAQKRFHWWPLHPLGPVVGIGWLTGQIWFSVFTAWLVKLVIVKYGGPRLFDRAKPFFLGLILGEAVVSGTWLLIDFLMGESGNHITGM